MAWVAKKALRVVRGGVVVDIPPGEFVPEAETWTNREAYCHQGKIVFVADESTQAPAPYVPLFGGEAPKSKRGRPRKKQAPVEPAELDG